MFSSFEKITTSSKSNVESALKAASVSFGNVERLAALNVNTARTLLDDSISNTRALVSVKDVRDLVGLQSSMLQPMVEKLASYNRSVYEIASQSQTEIARILEVQVAEMNKQFATVLDSAAKNAPASDVAVAAVKSALAAANSAYDNANKVAKQVAEIAEANMTAATNATVKAVSNATANTTSSTSKAASSKRAA